MASTCDATASGRRAPLRGPTSWHFALSPAIAEEPPACGGLRVGARGAASAGARMALAAVGGLPRPGRRPYAAVMHGHGGGGRTVLSQSEDQSRPHPTQHFVHPMSTQVRDLGVGTVEGGPRSDPQIATRTQNRASRQSADYTERRINLFRFAQKEAREPHGAGCSLDITTGGRMSGVIWCLNAPSGAGCSLTPPPGARHGYRMEVLMHLVVRGAP